MSNYVIFTDSACDISPKILKKWDVKYLNLSFKFTDSDVLQNNETITITEFYNAMRSGKVAKTSAVNVGDFKDAFEPILKTGTDILYLGFSSGLSTTYNSAVIAAEDLKEEYPNSRVVCVDTLCASAGFGMLLKMVVDAKNDGADLDAAAEYANSLRENLCHWFTVDDLVYLKRGGRISSTVAFVGGILGVKPVLHMDNEGHLVSKFKVRGRKAAIVALADQYEKLAKQVEKGRVYISHGDCIDDANALAKILKEKYNTTTEIITDVGAVIGAHSGPGTLALFFVGNER